MENKNHFSFSVIVTPNEIDELNHVNNIEYLNWVLQAAEKHWELLAEPHVTSKYAWVVLRHEIDYLFSAKLDDKIIITTWIGESYGVKSERFVEIKKEGKLLAKSKTIYCLLDKNTMKPLRIPEEINRLLQPDRI